MNAPVAAHAVTHADAMTRFDADRAEAVAGRLVGFLETGEVPDGLFAREVFCDLTLPTWRLQARGIDDTLALRRAGHPQTGCVPRWRCDPTPTGFMLEVEERWIDGGEEWYCRELLRADLDGDSIRALSVYCTGDWDPARQIEHARTVRLLEP